MKILEAINSAVIECMISEPNSIYLGEDVEAALRGFSANLISRFGTQRVRECPISESGFVGVATGSALTGVRAIVDLQISSLVYVAFDQLVDQALKLPYMMGGKVSVPVTYLIPCGSRQGLAGQHSDNPYALLMHMGMDCFMASDPQEGYDLLKYCFFLDKPTALFVPVHLFNTDLNVKFEPASATSSVKQISSGNDATIVTNGTTRSFVEDYLIKNGLQFRADHFNITHLNTEHLSQIVDSARISRRVVVLDDSFHHTNFARHLISELAISLSNEGIDYSIVSRPEFVVPFARRLEEDVVVQEKLVSNALDRIFF
jgi:pyruvate/2-oxoglutarate/acetoin dehydrogenase E1 component